MRFGVMILSVVRICLLSFFLFSRFAVAADNPFSVEASSKQNHQWARFFTYVPEKFDYYFELGSMWEARNQYWMGAGFGRHVGTCLLTQSQTCQQYWDIFGGAGGRDGLTTGLALSGLRWQFVNFPDVFSPSLRLFAGGLTIRDDVRDLVAFTYGIGYGITTSVHRRVDLRVEARVGMGDELWTQTMFSFHLKMDKWVDYFGAKIKKFGLNTLKATGNALEKGYESTQETVEEIAPSKREVE